MEHDSTDHVVLRDGRCPTIAEHITHCGSLFHKYMIMPDIVPDSTIMDGQLARFKLWAINMDVYAPPHASLDYRLRFSPTVVEIIHDLLNVICDALKSLKPINDSPQAPSRKRRRLSEHGNSEVTRGPDNGASDSASDVDQAEENISKITEIIDGTVARPFRLSNTFRKSAETNRAREIKRYRDFREANAAMDEVRLYTECYIRFRFPMAPDSLRSALAEANAMRLGRLYYQRSRPKRNDLGVENPQTPPTVVHLAKTKESAPSVLSMPTSITKTSGPAGPPPAPVTNATTARQTLARDLYAKPTAEVPQTKSITVNNKLSFPPIPPTHKCPYCGVVIKFKSTAKSVSWQNHVIEDLEPFICVFARCLEAGQHGTGPPTFATSKAWISHMQHAHGQACECRAPSHDPIIFDQEAQYQEHAIKEHGVPETHVGTLSSAARRPVRDKLLECCPFGDHFQPPEEAGSSAVFSSEALQAHLKEVALLTLQKLPGHVENSDNLNSGQPLEDDGLGLEKLCGSMYNMLEDEALDF